MSDLAQRITDYLSAGGLFNPELADHEAVRDLLIECRAALAITPQTGNSATAPASGITSQSGDLKQAAELMRLIDEYARAYATAWCENLYGTSKSYTKQCEHFRDEAAEAVRAALAAEPSREPVAHPQYWDDATQTGVGEWCGPGPADKQERFFILRYEDADRREAHYHDEDEARKAFARAEARGWNCHLFAHMPRIAAPAAPVVPDGWRPVPVEMHNQLTAGPAPWTDTRVPYELWHVARSVYGVSTEDEEKRIYRTVQAALWKLAAAPHAHRRTAMTDTRKLIEQCRDALAEELSAWDIDPPLFHVKEAHDACERWLAATPAPAAVPVTDTRTAMERFREFGGHEEPDPIERLRFFCSLTMAGQDWIDVEAFFDDVLCERAHGIAAVPGKGE